MDQYGNNFNGIEKRSCPGMRVACSMDDPDWSVEVVQSTDKALSIAKDHDLLIMDGGARSSAETLKLAKVSTLIVLPTGASLDDLEPTLRLARDLVKNGVDRKLMVFAFMKVSTKAEVRDAKEMLQEGGWRVLDGYVRDQAAYRHAQDIGKSITETKYDKLNAEASELLQSMANALFEERG